MSIKGLIGHVRKIVRRAYEKTVFLKSLKLSLKEKKYLEILKRDGVCVIENYWSRELCEKLKLKFAAEINQKADFDYPGGAYIRYNRVKNQKDEGVVRIYHLEKEFPEVAGFRYDPFILKMASAYYAQPMYSSFIAYQHNFFSEMGTREFHVDYWDNEFKAFLYLEDVTMENGPFCYIIGSNKAYKERKEKMDRDANTSFFDNDLKGWLQYEKPITGASGTLILADVVGFHRGLPQLTKTRSIIYNNLYNKNDQQSPQK